MNITLKDVPPELHKRLRKLAERSGRSLNKLILHTLDQALRPRVSDRAQLLSRITRRRNEMEVWLEDEVVQLAIEDGRE